MAVRQAKSRVLRRLRKQLGDVFRAARCRFYWASTMASEMPFHDPAGPPKIVAPRHECVPADCSPRLDQRRGHLRQELLARLCGESGARCAIR